MHLATAALLGLAAGRVAAQPVQGDLTGDGRVSVADAVRILSHAAGSHLPDELVRLADVDQDRAWGVGDAGTIAAVVVGARRDFPPTRIFPSPDGGESGVAVTRETVIDLGVPLADGADVGAAVTARFAGSDLDARRHLSAHRNRITLFYGATLRPSARVRLSVDGDALTDAFGRAVDADGDGYPGGTATLDFDTLSLASLPGTAITGQVIATELGVDPFGNPVDVPLQGVTITVDGAEGTLRTETGADGRFRLENCPAERFFVHVDGRTAATDVPEGSYYPFVGKAWTPVPCHATDVGVIYLPLVPPDALEPVSATEDTVVEMPPSVLAKFPELEGVSITVPAGALLADDGTRGGQVGIAPVPSDRLPGKLPADLDLPIVITVQTDSATNFDAPVAACFPNLPYESLGGEPLPAGGSALLYSFDHDTGEFSAVGSMTVTPDGKLGCTDPGVGIRAPGWHGMAPRQVMVRYEPGPVKCRELGPKEAWKFWKSIVLCLKNLLEIGPALKAVTSAIDLVMTTYQKIDDCKNLWSSGRFQDSQACVAIAKSACDAIKDAWAAFADHIPALKFLDMLQCASDLAASATAAFCDAFAQCSEGTQEFCNSFGDVIGSFNATFKKYGKLVEDITTGKFALEAACASLDNLKEILNYPGGEPPLPVGSQASSSPPTDEEIRAAFDAALRAMGEVSSGLSPETLEMARDIAVVDEAHSMLGQFEPLAVQAVVSSDSWAGSFIKLQQGSFVEESVYQGGGREWCVPQGGGGGGAGAIILSLYNPLLRAFATARYPGPVGISVGTSGASCDRSSAVRFGVFPGIKCRAEAAVECARFLPPPNGDSGLERLWQQCIVEGCGIPPRVTPLAPIRLLDEETLPDQDGDGLPDEVEAIVGTDPELADTDGDGLGDAAEIEQGLDPSDPRLLPIGTIGLVATDGFAQDTCSFDDVTAVADADAGLALYELRFGRQPTEIARVDTPGDARRVTCGSDLVLVADGPFGLAVVDVADPGAAVVARTIELGSAVTCVALDGRYGFAGTEAGVVALVDVDLGVVLSRLFLGEAVRDIAIERDSLVVVTPTSLVVASFEGLTLRRLGGVAMSSGPGNRRVAAGGGLVVVTAWNGFSTWDVSAGGDPIPIGPAGQGQLGWNHLALNGSGLGVGAVGLNAFDDETTDVSIYDVSDPAVTNVFVRSIPTPGFARAVSVWKGVAHVADGQGGYRVVNYAPWDVRGVAPEIALSTNRPDARAEEGQRVRVTADVTDDVQVREVRFFLDGREIALDGSFPFETTFVAPPFGSLPVVLTARATDTGGNSATSEPLTIEILPEATPPRVIGFLPPHGGVVGSPARRLSATFSELVDPFTLEDALEVVRPGIDGAFDTADDVAADGAVSWQESVRTATFTASEPLQPGRWRMRVTSSVEDAAGNALRPEAALRFLVISAADADQDGVPDDMEALVGTSPANPDSDGDGILDGAEDRDADGLSNGGEAALLTNPLDPDTDDDGILDGAEDQDEDASTDGDEILLGTDPLAFDTDFDGQRDGLEAELRGSGTDAGQGIVPDLVSRPSVVVTDVVTDGLGAVSAVATPRISLFPLFPDDGAGGTYVMLAGGATSQPPVMVLAPAHVAGADPAGTSLAQPPVKVTIP